jgi:hypothetical protein
MLVAEPVDTFGEAEEAGSVSEPVEPVTYVVSGGLRNPFDEALVGLGGAVQRHARLLS